MDGKCPCICIMSDKKDPPAALAASGKDGLSDFGVLL